MVKFISRLKESSFISNLNFPTIVILLLTISLVGSNATAITLEDDENDRSIHLEIEEKQLEIESILINGSTKDKISVHFKVSDEPEFEIGYQSESEAVEHELEFSIRFQALIEFLDLNNNNNYEESTDQLLTEFDLDLEYLDLSYITQNFGSGKIVHIINTTSMDGVFSLQFYVVESISRINGAIIVPSQIKLDIGINNFIFSEDSSKLALIVKLSSENEYEYNEETEDEYEGRSTDEQEVKVSMNNHTGFFSWSEFALVDGINHTVRSSGVLDDEGEEQKIYLTYSQGNRIIHDPKIGIIGIIVPPIIPTEIISNIISVFALAKEEYLLSIIAFTAIIASIALVLQIRKPGQDS